MKFEYPVVLERDDDGSCLVDFVDFPTTHTDGDDESEALLNAVEALEATFESYFQKRVPIPLPSPVGENQIGVEVPPMVAAKVMLWNEMHNQKLRKADLARSLDVHMPQIDRLFNVRHSSKFEMIESAAKALGKKITVELV